MSGTKKQTILNTPILFIVFKRLDTTKLVFEAIKFLFAKLFLPIQRPPTSLFRKQGYNLPYQKNLLETKKYRKPNL